MHFTVSSQGRQPFAIPDQDKQNGIERLELDLPDRQVNDTRAFGKIQRREETPRLGVVVGVDVPPFA